MESVSVAESQWARSAPAHYSYVAVRYSPLVATYKGKRIPGAARVEVKDGAVMSIWQVQEDKHGFRNGRRIPRSLWGPLRFSPAALFEEVHNSLAWASGSMDHTIDCSFDPATGFLARLNTDSRTLSDSYDVLEVKEFRALP